jgi:hypothetical protein
MFLEIRLIHAIVYMRTLSSMIAIFYRRYVLGSNAK